VPYYVQLFLLKFTIKKRLTDLFMSTLILASASPRRQRLLRYLGIDFIVKVPNIDELRLPHELPQDLVLRLSKNKAQTVFEDNQECVIIAADTVVALDNKILGKPRSDEESVSMLKSLSGRTHQVYTGTTIKSSNKCVNFLTTSNVTFCTLDENVIFEYVKSNEGADKAGSYALQGLGAIFIKSVEGSVSSVIGLPISEVMQHLCTFGFTPHPSLTL